MSDKIITAFGLVFYKPIRTSIANIEVADAQNLGKVKPVAYIAQSYDNTQVKAQPEREAWVGLTLWAQLSKPRVILQGKTALTAKIAYSKTFETSQTVEFEKSYTKEVMEISLNGAVDLISNVVETAVGAVISAGTGGLLNLGGGGEGAKLFQEEEHREMSSSHESEVIVMQFEQDGERCAHCMGGKVPAEKKHPTPSPWREYPPLLQ